MTVTVSCPYLGRVEIDAGEVVYEPNGDGTATYSFDCSCQRRWKTHLRHATIADLNQFRVAGCRTQQQVAVAAQRAMHQIEPVPISEEEIEVFALELAITDNPIEEELL